MSNNIKIKDFELENFKNLRVLKVSIGFRSFVIISKNGSGKSSVIDAIMSPMDKSVLPPIVITEGEERASVSVTIAGEVEGENREFKMDLFFTPSNGKGRLKLYNEKGEEIPSPSSYLDKIIGNFSFDVEDFLRGKDAKADEKRRKILMKISGCEEELMKLEQDKKKLITDREEMGREIKSLDSTVYSHGITEEEFQKYSEPCKENPEAIKANLDNLQPNIDKINAFKQKYDQLVNQNMSIQTGIDTQKRLNAEQEERIKTLEKEIETIKTGIAARNTAVDAGKELFDENIVKLEAGKKWLEEHKMPNVKEISDKLAEANTHVQTHTKIKDFEAKQKGLLKKKADYEDLQAKIAKVDTDKDKLLASSKLPKGITFNEEGIFFEGLPFDSKQQNTAKKMEISEDIVMAMNPGLKVLFVRDGSLYDKQNLKRLVDKAEAKGYQVIIEIVGENEEPEIKWIEEYLNPVK